MKIVKKVKVRCKRKNNYSLLRLKHTLRAIKEKGMTTASVK